MESFVDLEEAISKSCELSEIATDIIAENTEPYDVDEPIVKAVNQLGRCPVEGSGGSWDGERGNSDWYPDEDYTPGDRNGTNPDNKTWGEILDQYDIDSIPFNDGEPDFSEVSKATVKIEDFTSDRDANFDQADEKLAEQWKCEPEDISAWRKENKYTWHECRDCETMQLVPTEVHGNIPHSGGVAVAKMHENAA